jgi:mannose-6-phosphate isomerase-like protein (cupin superfamily)
LGSTLSSTLSSTELAALVRAYAADPASWAPVLRYPVDGEDRWWTRLESAAGVDVWLLSWLPGHATELHDHGRSAAAFVVVEGALTEVRATGERGITGWYERRAGEVAEVAVGGIHDVIAEKRPAVSIHAYSPPLEEMTYYRQRAAGGVEAAETLLTDDPEQGPRR